MNNKYIDLLDNTTDWFWEIDICGKFTYTNKVVEDLLGYKVSEILEMTPFDLMDQKTKEELSLLFNAHLIKPTKIHNLNHKAIKKDGTFVHLELNALPIFDENNKLEGFRGINRDITERIKEDKRKKHDFLSKILDYIPIPIFYKNKDGLYLGVNKSWKEMTGFDDEDIINKTVYDIAPKEIADIYYKQDEKVFNLEENPQIYESEVFNKKRNKKYKVIFNKSAFFDKNGNVEGIIGTIIDKSEITKLEEEKKENEKIMIQQSKLSSMGEMLENIAHQWRQPLSIISIAATGVKLKKEMNILSDQEFAQNMDSINNSAQHLSKTIDYFRNFFTPSDNNKVEFSIAEAVEKTLDLTSSNFLSRNIEIVKTIEDISIVSVENELIQVLVNILNNATDVLNKIGSQKKLILINIYTKEKYLIIEIKDNGGGIPLNIIDRIFEPYFTTKHQSQGTGIGLYMSAEIVKNNLKGVIKVENITYLLEDIEYKGAQFKIEIPLD